MAWIGVYANATVDAAHLLRHALVGSAVFWMRRANLVPVDAFMAISLRHVHELVLSTSRLGVNNFIRNPRLDGRIQPLTDF